MPLRLFMPGVVADAAAAAIESTTLGGRLQKGFTKDVGGRQPTASTFHFRSAIVAPVGRRCLVVVSTLTTGLSASQTMSVNYQSFNNDSRRLGEQTVDIFRTIRLPCRF